MAEIKVTSSELRNKATELRNLNNQFKNQVENMTGQEQALSTMWEGETKEAFHTAFMNDKTQMETFYQTIEKYCQTLEANAQQYENAETRNLNTASTRTYK